MVLFVVQTFIYTIFFIITFNSISFAVVTLVFVTLVAGLELVLCNIFAIAHHSTSSNDDLFPGI